MKSILRKIVIYTFILYLLPQYVPGFHVHGGLQTMLIGGLGLTIMFMFVKPILNIISFPINFLTLGFFSMITNVMLIYALTYFVKDLSVSGFSYPTIHFLNYTIPSISFNQITAYIFVAFLISIEESFLYLLLG